MALYTTLDTLGCLAKWAEMALYTTLDTLGCLAKWAEMALYHRLTEGTSYRGMSFEA